VRLVPAILTDSIDEYRHKLALAESFTDYAQVDFMDGLFVPSVSVPSSEVAGVRTSLTLEAHLMVQDPISYLNPLGDSEFVKAFFHFEAVPNHLEVINRIKDLQMKVGLAVNPGTEIDEFSGPLKDLDSVLFLTVDPGFYGSPFQPGVLEKFKRFRRAYPEIEAGIDGGVKLGNLSAVIAAGPDFICVGSAIFHASDPEYAFEQFQARIKAAGEAAA
jgi:ribulose-phosphate 3-epimerase